ncbi:hypothetical protein [Ferrovum myxofaciens]|uniref:hypothetical protein n=1 Tax=Ferrovum myxofaciens TaxID=416213 RepID=UPI003EBEC3AF
MTTGNAGLALLRRSLKISMDFGHHLCEVSSFAQGHSDFFQVMTLVQKWLNDYGKVQFDRKEFFRAWFVLISLSDHQ